MRKLRVLDLFSGIGGFSLGLERTGGFETVAFCEIDPYCRAVLKKHWPKVPVYEDVREVTGDELRADGISVDAICGGFPCQDISTAGKGAGLAGERSGLWSEYARIIGEVRPRFVIVETVAALLSRGLGRVLADLASLGYDAEWHCIPASAIGAPHRRDRVWIIAYADLHVHTRELASREGFGTSSRGSHTNLGEGETQNRERIWVESGAGCEVLADSPSVRLEGAKLRERENHERSFSRDHRCEKSLADAIGGRQSRSRQSWDAGDPAPLITRETVDAFNGRVGEIWRAEPDVGRVANGVPNRVDRLRALGNAVVPQIPEIIGHAILSAEAA